MYIISKDLVSFYKCSATLAWDRLVWHKERKTGIRHAHYKWNLYPHYLCSSLISTSVCKHYESEWYLVLGTTCILKRCVIWMISWQYLTCVEVVVLIWVFQLRISKNLVLMVTNIMSYLLTYYQQFIADPNVLVLLVLVVRFWRKGFPQF